MAASMVERRDCVSCSTSSDSSTGREREEGSEKGVEGERGGEE